MYMLPNAPLVRCLFSLALTGAFWPCASGQDERGENPNGQSLSPAVSERLLNEAHLRAEAERWRSNGYADIPVEVLPASVREVLGVTSGAIAPERFFTRDVQRVLLGKDNGVPVLAGADAAAWIEAWRRNGWPDIAVASLPAKVREALGMEKGTIPPEVFFGPKMQKALATHLGPLASVDTPEAVVDITHPSVSPHDREALRMAVERRFGTGAVLVTDPTLLRAFHEHADNETALRDAIEKAIPSLPAEMRQSLSAGFHVEMEDNATLGPLVTETAPDWLPTEQVLERISAPARMALAPYRHLLDERWELMRKLPDLPLETRRAAQEFLGNMRKPVPTASLYSSEDLQKIESAKERGYFEADGAPIGTQLLAAIEQDRKRANEHGARLGDGFLVREIFLQQDMGLPTVPAADIAPGSRNYVMAGLDASSQIYSRSSFGPVLLVRESAAAEFRPHVPNLFIAGHDGTVTWTKYDTGVWTTTVSGFNGRRVFHISVEAKLDGAERDRFVAMATTIIDGGYGF